MITTQINNTRLKDEWLNLRKSYTINDALTSGYKSFEVVLGQKRVSLADLKSIFQIVGSNLKSYTPSDKNPYIVISFNASNEVTKKILEFDLMQISPDIPKSKPLVITKQVIEPQQDDVKTTDVIPSTTQLISPPPPPLPSVAESEKIPAMAASISGPQKILNSEQSKLLDLLKNRISTAPSIIIDDATKPTVFIGVFKKTITERFIKAFPEFELTTYSKMGKEISLFSNTPEAIKTLMDNGIRINGLNNTEIGR